MPERNLFVRKRGCTSVCLIKISGSELAGSLPHLQNTHKPDAFLHRNVSLIIQFDQREPEN